MSASTSNPEEFLTLSSYPRAIAHVDCDAFFASVEQAIDPSLKGKPVVTGKERGIIACASYEAKAFGIKRGVSLRDAKRACPGLVILPSDYETYSIYSERMFSIMRRFTPDVEEFSIDEAFCDLTGLRRVYRASYKDISRLMKEEIEKDHPYIPRSEQIGLTVEEQQAIDAVHVCNKDLFEFYRKNRIYFSLAICNLTDRFCGLASYLAMEYLGVTYKDEAGNLYVNSKVKEVWDKATETIPQLLTQLEIEFRDILGVKS